jgi:membrane protease YdiL (CAAX protease family)
MTEFAPDQPRPFIIPDLNANEPPLAPAPTPRSPSDPAWIVWGADGIRAGWSLLIFLLAFIAILATLQFGIAKARHKPFGPAAERAAQQKADAETHKTLPPGAPLPPTPHIDAPASLMILGEASAFLAVLLATLLMAKIERRPFAVFGLGGMHAVRQCLQGFAWGISCLTLLILALKFTGLLHFDARLLSNPEALRFGLIWLAGFLLVALLEESLTRGYLQYTLARGLAGIYGAAFNTRHRHALGFWTAAFLLSFLFGLGHGSNPGESPIGLLSAGTAGFVFCLALYRTGSLWWAIGFHTTWDWGQSVLYGVADSGQMVQGHLFATHPIGKPILSGGLTGPEGSVLVLPTLGIVAAIISLTLTRTHHPGDGLAHPDHA